MRGFIISVIVIGGVVYAGKEWARTYQTRTALNKHCEEQLNLVDNQSKDSVRDSILFEAGKRGLKLTPANIEIGYDDTAIQSMAQKLVGKVPGVSYVNKRVTIVVRYQDRIAGVPVGQTISNIVIRQVEAPRLAPARAAQEVLDDP